MLKRLLIALGRVLLVLLVLVLILSGSLFGYWQWTLRPQIERDGGTINEPGDFPDVEIVVQDGATPGYVYFENYHADFLAGAAPFELDPWQYKMELDTTTGELSAIKRFPLWGLNFTRLDEDTLGYYKFPVTALPTRGLLADPEYPGSVGYYWGYFVITDLDFNPILEIKSEPNSYGIDFHELIRLDNGNIVYMDTSSEVRDLSDNDCKVDCLLLGQEIIEITPEGEEVYSLDLLDYYEVEDLTRSPFLDPPPGGFNVYDLIHANSVDVTPEGDWVVSVRHFDEVIKIDRETREVIWRMGGEQAVNNEFEFIDDPLNGFSHQHTAQILDNGNLLVFDNGNLHDTPISRVVEYEIDEENKTATLVWSYDDGRFTPVAGSAKRLENGNTIIGWTALNPNITEVNPEGEVLLEVTLPEGYATYRVDFFPKQQ